MARRLTGLLTSMRKRAGGLGRRGRVRTKARATQLKTTGRAIRRKGRPSARMVQALRKRAKKPLTGVATRLKTRAVPKARKAIRGVAKKLKTRRGVRRKALMGVRARLGRRRPTGGGTAPTRGRPRRRSARMR